MAELWDIYDENRSLTGRTLERGMPLQEGEYHLVADIWTVTPDKKILLSRRHPHKPYGGYWECTGGSVIAGENSMGGACRELFEEVGIAVNPEELIPILSFPFFNRLVDTYLVIKDVSLDRLDLQAEEVTDAMLVTLSQFMLLYHEGLFHPILTQRWKLYEEKLTAYLI